MVRWVHHTLRAAWNEKAPVILTRAVHWFAMVTLLTTPGLALGGSCDVRRSTCRSRSAGTDPVQSAALRFGHSLCRWRNGARRTAFRRAGSRCDCHAARDPVNPAAGQESCPGVNCRGMTPLNRHSRRDAEQAVSPNLGGQYRPVSASPVGRVHGWTCVVGFHQGGTCADVDHVRESATGSKPVVPRCRAAH